jgi:uncharacterized membrane protein YphA (DoxX/SURF4 family)
VSLPSPPGPSGTGARPPAPGPAATSGNKAWARAPALATDWAPVAGRILLALVLAWFGYHELVRPGLWTGYVPVVSPASSLGIVAVLIHGWLLLVLAVALAAGLATRLAALLAAVLLLEIVISLTISGGLSDLTLRDAGVLGLAITLTGVSQRRLVLRH